MTASSESDDGNITGASYVLGTIGTVLWCIQLIPQIWYNWRRKKTDGFPPLMMLLWASCAVPMGAYMVLQEVNLPLQIQPQIFGFFSLVSWGQILYYNHSYTCLKATSLVVGTAMLFGGIETLLILTLRIPYNKGVTWPDLVVGVVAAILLASGLVPPYFELWKRDGRVIGFNWVFLSIDTLGGLFSLFALAAQGSFDILGGIMYILVVVLEAGIYASHIIWRIRYRAVRKEARASGRSIDEVLEERNQGETPQDNKKDGIISHHRRNNSPVQLQQQQSSEPKVTQSISEGNDADA
ncbi:PQ-loop repeat-containing protein [Aspergillus tubingensis]|uniref:PQ-loop repeat-containing protein n=1 Tax=Aspergillus tubingensis TaxID=5068 RepID=UPI001578784F|nr:PQ loop repeat protein [Aspergillus tubingensis]GFN20725.1 PQ loop repeat protein [Aspergillus tubingensis]